MTIKPGDPWGQMVPLPADAVEVHDDDEVAELVTRGTAVLVRGGDLARTLGALTGRSATANALPIDLIETSIDGAPVGVACAHVVARRPWWRGGWLSGPVLLVMHAEFLGSWDVAPRGHPNDGRAEVFETVSLSLRQRLAARRRLRTAAHVPHPEIVTRSVRTASFEYDEELEVLLDGRRTGRASTIAVRVIPDAAVVYA